MTSRIGADDGRCSLAIVLRLSFSCGFDAVPKARGDGFDHANFSLSIRAAGTSLDLRLHTETG